jgi:hypothetical protein
MQTLVGHEPHTAPKDFLSRSVDRLEDALAGEVVRRERCWAADVARALRRVERGLRRYYNVDQAADDPIADLDRMRPTLFRQWNILHLHFRDLFKRAQRLRRDAQRAAEAFQPVGEALAAAVLTAGRASSAEAVPVFGDIRQRALEILSDLNRSREAQTALLLESVVTDIGVGD